MNCHHVMHFDDCPNCERKRAFGSPCPDLATGIRTMCETLSSLRVRTVAVDPSWSVAQHARAS